MVTITIFALAFSDSFWPSAIVTLLQRNPSFPALFFFFKKKRFLTRKDFRDGLVQQSSTSYGNHVHTELTGLCSNICRWGSTCFHLSGRQFSLWTTNKQQVFFKLRWNLLFAYITGLNFIPHKACLPALSQLPPLPPRQEGEILTSPQSSLVQADLCPRDNSQSPYVHLVMLPKSEWTGTMISSALSITGQPALFSLRVLVTGFRQ